MNIEDRKRLDNKIDALVAKGHSNHCACRQVLGKSKCICGIDKIKKENRK